MTVLFMVLSFKILVKLGPFKNVHNVYMVIV